MKSISLKLDQEHYEVLERLKETRRTKNNAQIFREGIYCLAEKILPEYSTNAASAATNAEQDKEKP